MEALKSSFKKTALILTCLAFGPLLACNPRDPLPLKSGDETQKYNDQRNKSKGGDVQNRGLQLSEQIVQTRFLLDQQTQAAQLVYFLLNSDFEQTLPKCAVVEKKINLDTADRNYSVHFFNCFLEGGSILSGQLNLSSRNYNSSLVLNNVSLSAAISLFKPTQPGQPKQYQIDDSFRGDFDFTRENAAGAGLSLNLKTSQYSRTVSIVATEKGKEDKLSLQTSANVNIKFGMDEKGTSLSRSEQQWVVSHQSQNLKISLRPENESQLGQIIGDHNNPCFVRKGHYIFSSFNTTKNQLDLALAPVDYEGDQINLGDKFKSQEPNPLASDCRGNEKLSSDIFDILVKPLTRVVQ